MAHRKITLGDMKRVEARTVWGHEEHDFTPWLCENLEHLGEALGLELELEEREGDVGDFSVDIVARDLSTNQLVVIENQIEPTDHRHLGQLLTYAAGREAGVVVWISPEFRDEHREALDWLNREGGDGRPKFFGVALEVLQIDDSNPAVNFRLVASPNDWTREIKKGASTEASEKGQRYVAFFQALLDDLRARKWTNARKAQPQNWYSFSSGHRGYVYSVSFASGGRLRAELYIDAPDVADSKAAFQRLLDQRQAIEAALGEPLTWEKLEGRRACRVAVYREGSIEDASEVLQAHHAWMVEKLVKLKQVFDSRLEP